MATKSPGVYFQEYDNTAYTNPKSTSGTTVAVVGYANKGPIGTPTEITSWTGFKSTFGKPVDGYYSGLAVKNILSAGGTVLFDRVADSTASKSNYVVKNPVTAVNGYTTFARAADILIGVSGYSNGYVYTTKVTEGDTSKVFFVRSPASGKLTQTSVLSQLLSQVSATSGTWEKVNSSLTAGFYSFNVNLEGTAVSTNGFYTEVLSDQSGTTLAETISSAVSTGTNAIDALTLTNSASGTSTTYYDPSTVLGFSGEKKFKIIKNGTTYTKEISIAENTTLEGLASQLDSELSSTYGIRCILDKGSNGTTIVQPKLVFVLKEKTSGNSLLIGSAYDTEADGLVYEADGVTIKGSKDLFLSTSTITNFASVDVAGEYVMKISAISSAINSDSLLSGFTVSYNSSTDSIIFTDSATGSTSSIEVVKATYGNFLFDENYMSGATIGSIAGQDAIDISVFRNSSTKLITFQSNSTLEYPVLANITATDIGMTALPSIFGNLLTIEKDPSVSTSTGYINVEGTSAVDSSTRDMVVFTSKECGSGTANNIVVEAYTSTSPVDSTTKHDITITVNGTLVETYEDVSYVYDDVDKRFDTLINEASENGGSNYITVTVVKNNFSDKNVELPDGEYTIGAALKADDVKKTSDVDYSAYTLYDYAVGDDGIPDNGDEIFEAAMTTDTSKLANKDLYDFHILITPDDISQTVQDAAIALCENREDAVTIIDPPIGLDIDSVIDWHNGRGYGRSVAPTSNYAATYYPWCKVYDNTGDTGKYTWVMPSVVMAAKYVTVDKTAGCWYAPAGETNGTLSVTDIEQYPNKVDRDNLYLDYNRVNPITKFKDGSIVCYGEKTLQRTNSVLTKIHTRRMLVEIKKQCREALKGYIFMPNTNDYLGKISSNMTAILEVYKAGGGLSYYKVICDDTNNTTETSQQDIVNVDVILVPTGTIEQINISLTLNKTAETVTD